MVVWKKTLCMALCLTMMTSAVGCNNLREAFGGDSTDSSVDNSQNQEIELTETEAETLAESYYNGLLATAEGVKSFAVSASLALDAKTEYVGEDGKIDESLTETDSNKATFDIVVSQTDAGVVIKLYAETDGTYYYYENGEEVEIAYTSYADIIVTPDYTYQRNYEIDESMTADEIAEQKATKWYKSETTFDEEITTSINEVFESLPEGLLDKLLATKEIKDAEQMLISASKNVIKEALLAGAIKGGISFEEDLAGKANEIMTFLEGIDEEKDTLGKVINHALTAVAPGLTAEALLGQLKAYSKMTVSEALTSIDEFLASTYQTDLQTIKDEIVNSEFASVLFKDAFVFEDDIVQQIKDWKVASLKEGEYKDVIVSDFINTFLVENEIVTPPEEGEAPNYCMEGLAMAEAALDATLAELDIEIPSFKGINLEEVKVSSTVKFTDKYWLESVSDAVSLKLTVENFNDEGAVEYYGTLGVQAALNISNISDKAVTIELPAEADIEYGLDSAV